MSESLEIDFYTIYAWVGICNSAFCVSYGLFGLSSFIRFSTRFVEEVFCMFSVVCFAFGAFKDLNRSKPPFTCSIEIYIREHTLCLRSLRFFFWVRFHRVLLFRGLPSERHRARRAIPTRAVPPRRLAALSRAHARDLLDGSEDLQFQRLVRKRLHTNGPDNPKDNERPHLGRY